MAGAVHDPPWAADAGPELNRLGYAKRRSSSSARDPMVRGDVAEYDCQTDRSDRHRGLASVGVELEQLSESDAIAGRIPE